MHEKAIKSQKVRSRTEYGDDSSEAATISQQLQAASRTLAADGNPALAEAIDIIRANADWDRFGSRYTTIPEAEFFNRTLRSPEFIACHIAQDREGRPVVRTHLQVGDRVEQLRTLALKLLMIAEDAEKLAALPKTRQACRVY